MEENNFYEDQEVVTVKEWLITFLLLCIPIANIVLMFIWAFSSTEKKSKSNYFKASLIMAAIAIVLQIIFVAILGIGFAGALGQF